MYTKYISNFSFLLNFYHKCLVGFLCRDTWSSIKLSHQVGFSACFAIGNGIDFQILISDNLLLAYSKPNDFSMLILSNSQSDDNGFIVIKYSAKELQHQGKSSFVYIAGKTTLAQLSLQIM